MYDDIWFVQETCFEPKCVNDLFHQTSLHALQLAIGTAG